MIFNQKKCSIKQKMTRIVWVASYFNPKALIHHLHQAYEDRVNTHILVATITFVASVTAPNNLISQMLHKFMFYAFTIGNIIAMYTFILVAIVLIWSHLGNIRLVRASIDYGVSVGIISGYNLRNIHGNYLYGCESKQCDWHFCLVKLPN